MSVVAYGVRRAAFGVRHFALAAVIVASIGMTPCAYGESVSAEGGTLKRGSQPVTGNSTSVHEPGNSIGARSAGSMKSGPVRDATTRGMRSGPLSEISRGPVHSSPSKQPAGGPVAEASAGAVKSNPIGERISDPLDELDPLRERLHEMLSE